MQFKEGHVLKLSCSLYDLQQSPHNFFGFLTWKLEKYSFVQGKHHP